MTSVLQAAQLSKTFSNGRRTTPAVRGVDIAVEAGEWIAIMGPSGCGKTTLLHLLGGLDVADSGTVHIAGVSIGTLSESARARLRRRHIGYVFQQYNLIHGLDVEANVELPCLLVGTSRRDARVRSRELLGRLGLGDARRASPAELSGGEQQRVAIARALANRPTLLLADEPTGALDSEASRTVVELLRAEHAAGQTIVMVTHDHRVASRADRVLVMNDGVITDERAMNGGPPTEFTLSNLVALEL